MHFFLSNLTWAQFGKNVSASNKASNMWTSNDIIIIIIIIIVIEYSVTELEEILASGPFQLDLWDYNN